MSDNLTPREQEILDMLIAGASPKEIGYNLNISYDTVKYHQKKLYEKLGVKSFRELWAQYNITNSADSKEKLGSQPLPSPFSLTLDKNPPWGFNFNFEPDVFQYNGEWHPSPFKLGRGNRLVEGDLWHVTCFFTVNVDLDYILLGFFDATIEEDGFYTEISGLHKLGNWHLKANTRYNLSAKILVTKTANGSSPAENMFKFGAQRDLNEQPVFTFHKLEVSKLPQQNILKSVLPVQRQVLQTEMPVPYPLKIAFYPGPGDNRWNEWIYWLDPDVFLYEGKRTPSPFKLGDGNRVVEDDIFLVNMFFTSNIDIDLIQVQLMDTTITADNNWTQLSPYLKIKKNIKAGIENNITVKLLAIKTASGVSPDENKFLLVTGPDTKEQPVLTFSKFEVVKI